MREPFFALKLGWLYWMLLWEKLSVHIDRYNLCLIANESEKNTGLNTN